MTQVKYHLDPECELREKIVYEDRPPQMKCCCKQRHKMKHLDLYLQWKWAYDLMERLYLWRPKI